MTPNENASPRSEPDLEQLWQFAGQGLRAADFNTAMVHFYRAEVGRSNTWRTRLDTTTNWAVITTGATLSFAFSSPTNLPLVLLINTLLVLLFLLMEARRYRYYEMWMYRVRILEQNFLAGLLSPPFVPRADWADRLSDSLHAPRFPISLLEAFGRRYRRNYAPIFLILAASWILKIYMHPTPAAGWAEFWQRAAIGPLPSGLVVGTGVVFHGALMALGLLSVSLRTGTDPVAGTQVGVLARISRFLRHVSREILETDLPHLPSFDTRKQMAFIISDSAESIGQALLTKLHRGVTLLHGTGLYTGQEHGVLLVTFEAKQLSDLKRTLKEIDARAFLIVSPVQGVHGTGFRPLEA